MHELGVVFHVIDDVSAIAAENNVSSIEKVILQVGTVSGIIDDYLTDCWNWAVSKHELTKGCELEIEHIEAVSHCDSCGKDFDTVSCGKICPECGSDNTYLVCGNEFIIKEIVVT